MNGTTVNGELNHELESRGFDGNDGLESHMASYVEFLMSDGRWFWWPLRVRSRPMRTAPIPAALPTGATV
jgi:hypothetical protein